MTNRLHNQNSPYLLQHKDNPVDWYPWGTEALQRAKKEDKPIFLSVGYAACHWCHVMEHESFEDAITAELMNQYFINIKVDREERPDIDGLYMNAVVAMTGQGGWPMSIFLTPDGKPFFGGTYFPPTPRYNMPSFRDVLRSVADVWAKDRQKILDSSENITQHLQNSFAATDVLNSGSLEEASLKEARDILERNYDWQHGGWGQAPKFPQPMVIEFLLKLAANGDTSAKELAVHALEKMALGGMYDVVGGGFSRYSTDADWLIPHFEKMLYDNALLSRVYLYAYLITGNQSFRYVCEETLDFVLREMTGIEGGFFSSLDADSEGKEGVYYLWDKSELAEVIKNPLNYELFISAYGVTDQGNFEGRTVLQRKLSDQELADQFDLTVPEIHNTVTKIHEDLRLHREKRIRPATDDKVLVSWNALMMRSFAEAARFLGREDYLKAAQKNAHFILGNLVINTRLHRSWRSGKSQHNAYLEDHGGLICGLLALYQSDFDNYWFQKAYDLTNTMIQHFQDPAGGFFDTRDDHEELFQRPKDTQDNATPSGGSLAVYALLLMAAYTGEGRFREIAESSIKKLGRQPSKYPTAFGFWLTGLHFALGPVQEVAVIGPTDSDKTIALLQTLKEKFYPLIISASSPEPIPDHVPALLKNRTMVSGQPTAFVCQNFICKLPVNSPRELSRLLG